MSWIHWEGQRKRKRPWDSREKRQEALKRRKTHFFSLFFFLLSFVPQVLLSYPSFLLPSLTSWESPSWWDMRLTPVPDALLLPSFSLPYSWYNSFLQTFSGKKLSLTCPWFSPESSSFSSESSSCRPWLSFFASFLTVQYKSKYIRTLLFRTFRVFLRKRCSSRIRDVYTAFSTVFKKKDICCLNFSRLTSHPWKASVNTSLGYITQTDRDRHTRYTPGKTTYTWVRERKKTFAKSCPSFFFSFPLNSPEQITSEAELPTCSSWSVCSKVDTYSTPWIEKQCRCPGEQTCSMSLDENDGHTITDKSRLLKVSIGRKKKRCIVIES